VGCTIWTSWSATGSDSTDPGSGRDRRRDGSTNRTGRTNDDPALVEPQRSAQIADLLRRRLLTEHERRGIPGRQVEQPEDHHGDEPEQQQRVERPPD
jgi:hypothetical protein